MEKKGKKLGTKHCQDRQPRVVSKGKDVHGVVMSLGFARYGWKQQEAEAVEVLPRNLETR